MEQLTIDNGMTIVGTGEGTVLVGRYRVVRQLGQGGMGSVWLAEDTKLDNKLFAVKTLPAILVANKRAYRQLKDEALVAMKLTHPNIVTLRAFEENDGNPFLVMDYIDGQSLDDYLAEKGKMSEEEALGLLKPVAAALDYAHLQGVVHRDVKPANVMIRKDGVPFILDFGIAREIQETMTRVTGKLSSGTLLYMSPEQLNGAQPTKEQDVYSFAAMAYECLKGEPPFARGQIEHQILNNPPPPIDLPAAGGKRLVASVMAGLAKSPGDRPPTCAAVLGGERATPQRGSTPVGAPRRGGARKAILPLLLLGLAFAGGVTWHRWQEQKREQVAAEEARKKAEEEAARRQAEETRRRLEEEKRLAAEQKASTEIRVEARVQKDKVERISEEDGFKERKVALAETFARAEALFDEKTKRWAEAAQGFSNYVARAEALRKLDGERQSAAKSRKHAQEAFRAAEKEGAKEYAATRWNAATEIWNSAAAEFYRAEFSAASNTFASAAAQFEKCIEEAKVEGARKKKEATIAAAYKLFEDCKYEELLQGADMKDSTLPDVLYLQGLVLFCGLTGTCDYAKAVQKYEVASTNGLALATVDLGTTYCAGMCVKKDMERGLSLIEKGKAEIERLAKEGNPYAEDILGDLYSNGWGYPSNKTVAAQWYKRGAEKCYVNAMRDYGGCLFGGTGTETNMVMAADLLERAYAKGAYSCAFLLGCYWLDKDARTAADWFRRCHRAFLSGAEQGNYDLQYAMGILNENGWGCETNKVEAVRWFAKAADQGYADAQNRMGLAYDNGLGVRKDYDEALRWYRKAVEQGHAVAQLNLGLMYWEGKGVDQDYWTAVKWISKAAEQGVANAQHMVGFAYEEGKGVEKDYDKAVEWYTKAAEQGHAIAQNNLGLMYGKGIGVIQNYWTAEMWLRKAADQGYAESQFVMGFAYEEGKGVEEDYDKAVEWYTKAAEQGHAIAQNNLGLMYWKGRGVEQNYWTAVKWLRKAADQGYAESQFAMGLAYDDGNGVEKDYEKAMEWYTKAAEQGHMIAQNNIGILYWEGKGVNQSYWNALMWLRKAADQGMANAQQHVGLAYDNGYGVEKNYGEALLWYTKAAEQGHAIAQNNLGVMYWDGKGVGQNPWTAVEWYRKAADQGLAMGQFNLGQAYEEGRGVQKNRLEAIQLYRKAAAQGLDTAITKLRQLGVRY